MRFRTPAIVGALALGLIGTASSSARTGPDPGSHLVSRAVFALAAPHGGRAQRETRRLPNPAFAGYSTAGSGVTVMVARFKVPGVACSKPETAIGPGAFLLTGPRDRVSFNAANIIVGCYRGTATAQEAIDVDGVESDYVRPVQPGDTIVARLTDTPGGQIVVQLRNLNPRRRFALRRTGRGSTPQSELAGDWASIDAKSQSQLPPPDFEPTTFRGVSVDGHPIGSLSPTGYNMASSSQALQIATSPLRGPAQDTFTCTRGA